MYAFDLECCKALARLSKVSLFVLVILQVVGGASIGNTDPYVVMEAVDEQLGSCRIPLEAAPLV